MKINQLAKDMKEPGSGILQIETAKTKKDCSKLFNRYLNQLYEDKITETEFDKLIDRLHKKEEILEAPSETVPTGTITPL